jgi:hypothetical protein
MKTIITPSAIIQIHGEIIGLLAATNVPHTDYDVHPYAIVLR